MKILVLLLSLVAVCWSLPLDEKRHKRETTCLPPTNLNHIFESLNQNLNSSLFLQLGSLSNQIQHLPSELNTHLVPGEQTTIDTTCPSSVSDDPTDPVWTRSICPWWYNITILPAGHFPAVIPQAVCKCQDCVGTTLNECTLISTNIRVLKEIGCQDGFLKYQPVLKEHHVGCTCIRKRVAQNNNCGGWGCTS